MFVISADTLYEECAHCHLFVEPDDGYDPHASFQIMEFVHLHRGDAQDEKLDESHEPAPSGRKANLATWKCYGPVEMRRRFVA